MGRVEDKIAFITGAASGPGRAAAILSHAKGPRLPLPILTASERRKPLTPSPGAVTAGDFFAHDVGNKPRWRSQLHHRHRHRPRRRLERDVGAACQKRIKTEG